MIPDWYPGDLMIIDRKLDAKAGRIVVGYLEGEPMARRLVRDGKSLLLVASNRNYPPIPFDAEEWIHVGVLLHAVRDLAKRYSGPDPE
jgi:DNA polymerase V